MPSSSSSDRPGPEDVRRGQWGQIHQHLLPLVARSQAKFFCQLLDDLIIELEARVRVDAQMRHDAVRRRLMLDVMHANLGTDGHPIVFEGGCILPFL